MFQRRHILEHNGGIVDSKYLTNSKDTTYTEGQRLVIRDGDAIGLIKVIKKLGQGIQTLGGSV